jgi:polar amino acid transport system substrate-binding protein
MLKFFDCMLAVTDAIGLASFTVTGVIVCMITKTHPLWLWGPFMAFITGAGGGILRDLMIRDSRHKIGVMHGEPYGEVAILWGAILSSYLILTTSDIDPSNIKLAVILTILLCFLTRMAVYLFRIPNLFFPSSIKREDQ